MLLLAGCLLFDDTPYLENLARLTDADGDGWSLAEGDCNDVDPRVNPGEEDVCDGADNNCDEEVPDTIWCLDLDGDGFGDPTTARTTCFPSEQQVRDCTDCDDLAGLVYPGQPEVCNGYDDNCDGVVDPDGAPGSTVWYADVDEDGYGSTRALGTTCEPIAGGVTDTSDCDDQFADTHPGAGEVCGDGRDNNCDGDRNGCGWGGEALGDVAFGAFVDGLVEGEGLGLAVGIVDTDGNGVLDVVVGGSGRMYGDSSRGGIHIWYGAPVGERTVEEASAHLIGEEDAWLAQSGALGPPAWYGDIEGDGIGELVVLGAEALEGLTTDAGVFFTLEPGFTGDYSPTAADVAGEGWYAGEAYGYWVRNGGSLGGDERTLLVAASYNHERARYGGAVYVVPGASPNAADHTARILGTADYDLLGQTYSSERDLDGDGIDDLAMGTRFSDSPAVYIFRGPLSGEHLAIEADTILTHEVTEDYGDMLLSIPDADGDGHDDLAVSWRTEDTSVASPGRLYLASGLASGTVDIEGISVAVLTNNPTSGGLATSLALGDIAADGVPDLVVAARHQVVPEELGGVGEGAVAIVPLQGDLRGEVSLWSVADATFYGAHPRPYPDDSSSFGYRIAVGDTNRDGFDDLLIGEPGFSPKGGRGQGAAWLLYGGGI